MKQTCPKRKLEITKNGEISIIIASPSTAEPFALCCPKSIINMYQINGRNEIATQKHRFINRWM
ncbi:hypothetical protein [Acinetobacter sp. CFCC 10889]|uniref:hypothetical protein n=1 Tax=Acinetobacter sp. CFCC 10889 TaxID=1775557 RepID=UPI0013A6C0A2|nr:hypothetical protein [Acinetobacter sp. CFCC 10889]